MHIKTILNQIHPIKGFVYKEFYFSKTSRPQIEITIEPDRRIRPICSVCGESASTYDTSPKPRRFKFIPLWHMMVTFVYYMRRVDCHRCGVKVERVPWSDGKHHTTFALRSFLANWSKDLSWKRVAERFDTSWETVYRSVGWVVDWGLEHRDLKGIKAIGVDEVLWHRGHKYLTLVYQIDAGRRRLLWIGRDRTTRTFLRFSRMLDKGQRRGERFSEKIRYACSDMWKPYLKVIKKKCPNAIHILDRFHIKKKFTEAVDQVRREEVRRLREGGYEAVLTKSRFIFLKNPVNLTKRQASKLKDLVTLNLRTVRAWLLKEEFERFWTYRNATWAKKFLKQWTTQAMHSRLDPMKKVAKTLRAHEDLILNWFQAKGMSSGIVEGMNTKVKLITRRSYGFRTYKATETALYHALGDLPEPKMPHRFC